MKWSMLTLPSSSPGPQWETKGFCHSISYGFCYFGRQGRGQLKMERKRLKGMNICGDKRKKKKKNTFLHTKGNCWLIALGNTQRLLCNSWLSMQGLLSTAAIEEEGEKKELKWIQGLFTEKCPSHIITLLSSLVKKKITRYGWGL